MQNTTYQKTINKSEFNTSSLDHRDSYSLLNNNCRDTSSAHMHKHGYQERIFQPVKISTQDMPDTLPKDNRPPIASKVTVAFAVEEWFQILLVHMNNPHDINRKVLEPMRAF